MNTYISKYDELSEALAANAICLYDNDGAESCIEYLAKLSFSQLMSIRDCILSGHGHLSNNTQRIIVESVRAITLNDPSICSDTEKYIWRYI